MLLFNKGESSIMFVDGGETKFLAPMTQMVIKDEAVALKILHFYHFVEEISLKKDIKKEVKEELKKKKKKKKKVAEELGE